MNVRDGDLAIVVGAYQLQENISGLVRVVRPYSGWEDPAWWCETLSHFKAIHESEGGVVRPIEPGTMAVVLDSQLRPIRDNDGPDETLDWAPLKEREVA